MISETRMEQALKFLAETDEEYAEKKTNVERQAWCRDQAEARVFQLAEGNIPDRKATAELSSDVSEATERWLKAMLESKKLEAKRATQVLVIETWRSLNANRRQGNVA